jgi:hypothetical protein
MPGPPGSRGYKPRPQEPHSLHQSAVTGRRPSISERCRVTDVETKVNGLVTPQADTGVGESVRGGWTNYLYMYLYRYT